MELTPNQKAFITKLWDKNPAMAPQKTKPASLAFQLLHNPTIIGLLYYTYFMGGPTVMGTVIFWWMIVMVSIAGLATLVGVVVGANALSNHSLESRMKYDEQFLSHALLTGLFDNNVIVKINFFTSAVLMGMFFVVGMYGIAIYLIVVKLLGEWQKRLGRKFVIRRLEEISGNLFIY